MKKFLMNISAALLVVWYCMSIIGFDVHTCMSSGRIFISTFAEGISCADIHPEHHHDDHEHTSCCSSENHEESFDVKSCCTNEYQMIQLSGCRADNNSDEKHTFSKVSYPCVTNAPVKYIAMAKYHAEHVQFLESDSGVLQPGDICVTFGVWRI